MDNKLASPLTLLKRAWSLALSRPNIISYLALGAIPQLLSLATSTLLAYASGTTGLQTTVTDIFTNAQGWGIVSAIVIGLGALVVVSLVSTWYSALLYTVYQATAAGTMNRLTTYVRTAKAVTIHLLLTYITVGLITSVGFLLLVIPGIVIAVRYMFAPTVAAVEDRAIKPIEESRRLVNGRFWKLVGRSVLMIACYNVPLYILQAIHPWLSAVWAVTSPVFGLYFFLVYLDFKKTAAVAS